MPRLALDTQQAADIAAYFSPALEAERTFTARGGNAARGRELMEQKACSSCHAFSEVPEFSSTDAAPVGSELARSAALAPDLRFTRQRFRRDRLLEWLVDPRAVKPDTRMPNFGLSDADADARDIAAYILGAEVAPEPGARRSRACPCSRAGCRSTR